ncbi:hypothetical protein GCK32_001441 [Trichostrongylus colubriformis]|uniref:DUF6795 domain-containing protein n=1 Tax=Trichostrongylus colubriformis TaxID=6319 RepID=A0AAN8ERH2_TRICO
MNFPFFVALMVLQPWLCNQKFIPIISVVGKILCQGKPAKDIDVSIDLFSPSHAQTKTDGKGVFHLKAYSDLNHRKFWSRISIRHKCYANEEDKEVSIQYYTESDASDRTLI